MKASRKLPALLAALKKCRSTKDLEKGMMIHADAVDGGYSSNILVANSLISMYAKCGSMVDARRVFDGILHPDVVSWSALLLGYAENGAGEVALDLFWRMGVCSPNSQTFVAVLKACTVLAVKESGRQVAGGIVKLESLKEGMAIHARAANSGWESDIFVAAGLVDMYGKCGSMVDCRRVFDRIPFHNVVLWNALILGYVESGEAELAVKLFSCMASQGCVANERTFVAALKACAILAVKDQREEVKRAVVKMEALKTGTEIHAEAAKSGCESDIYVANTLVDMYAKCGSLMQARKVFDGMVTKTIVSWTAMLLGYAQNGETELALEIISRMRAEGLAPTTLTFVAALKACGISLDLGKAIHAEICRHGLENDLLLRTSLMDVYSKCGRICDARRVFDSLKTADIVTWNALLAGYSRLGDTKQVFYLFHEMREERLEPDAVALLCVLTACSNAGLVEKGKACFEAMRSKRYGFGPSIEHYHCMVNMLARANRLPDAVEMVKSMPYVPNAVTWRTVLSACQEWQNETVGKLALEAFDGLEQRDATGYLLMANLYSNSAGSFKKTIHT